MGRLIRTLVVLAAVAGSLAGQTAAVHGQSLVRFGSVGGLTDAGLYLADEMGYFAAEGVKVEMKRMANAPALMAAIATNQLDVVGLSATPGVFTAVQQGIKLKVVGDKQSIRPGFAATRLIVRKELAKPTANETINSLKGRSVAISSKLSASALSVALILREQKVDLKDVNIRELSYPSMVTALTTGAVDAAYVIEPFLSQVLQAGIAVDVSNVGDFAAQGSSRTSVPLIFSEGFAANRKVAQGFMDAYVRGVRDYNDAFVKNKDRDKVIGVIARRADVAEDIVRRSFPAGLDPNQAVNRATLEEMQDFFIEQGFMKQRLDVNDIVDESFAKASVERFGAYK